MEEDAGLWRTALTISFCCKTVAAYQKIRAQVKSRIRLYRNQRRDLFSEEKEQRIETEVEVEENK